MRFIIVSLVLIIAASFGFGQDRTPQHIRSSIYMIGATTAEAEPDTAKYASNRYYTEDGTDCTHEVLGFMRESDVVQYDDRDNVIERNIFWSNGDFLSRHIYTYDDQNRKIEIRMEDEHTDLITRDEIDYDQAGNKIRSEKFDANGNSILKTTYQYNTTAHQIHYTEYKKGKVDIRYTHTYDPQDNLIKKEWLDAQGRCYSWSIFGYIAQGDPLYECTFDDDNELAYKKEYLYLFDAYGSWIERREYENDRLTQIVKRKITYYD